MSVDIVIRVEALWKEYRLGAINHGTLKADLASWWARISGREDPNLRLNHSNPTTSGNRAVDCFWALQDVNFDVRQGEVLGVIGGNGAGKSTLLKILSRVTTPTKGLVQARGRIASLLEVGTGFHPDLTGRENIFLNGAILGMRRDEIAGKFDQIVDFAGVERFIDTPVKRYSSGMYVRLAFAVAAHLDSDILVIDEVLAVGDQEFQDKCLGKMNEVSRSGRTVLFVSHQMASVRSICNRAILLSDGNVAMHGDVEEVIPAYFSKINGQNFARGEYRNTKLEELGPGISYIKVFQQNNLGPGLINDDADFYIRLNFLTRNLIEGIQLCIAVYDNQQRAVFSTRTDVPLSVEPQEIILKIESHYLSDGNYSLFVSLMDTMFHPYDSHDHVCDFTVVRTEKNNRAFPGGTLRGCVFPRCQWISSK